MTGSRDREVMFQRNDIMDKRRRSMKHRALFLASLVAVAVTFFATTAGAFDTSPYLVGTWEETGVISTTGYRLVNPTTKPLDVHMFFFAEGAPFGCVSFSIPANGTFYLQTSVDVLGPHGLEAGTVKFFAFPAGTRKFDPNAVIGGFQAKSIHLPPDPRQPLNTEANLKAVVINSYTLGEYTQIPWYVCQQ
jgi:hypothetical protein